MLPPHFRQSEGRALSPTRPSPLLPPRSYRILLLSQRVRATQNCMRLAAAILIVTLGILGAYAALASPWRDGADTPSTTVSAGPDDDDDGFTDEGELLAGSDPLNPDSTPELVDFRRTCFDEEDNDLDGLTDRDDDGCIDSDGDSIPDVLDNCPRFPSRPLYDQDGDGLGNECDDDDDGDGVLDGPDICFETLAGAAVDASGCSDAEVDGDGDGFCSPPRSQGPSNCVGLDNCPDEPNPSQADGDTDDFGDACDNCPGLSNVQDDADSDGAGDECDNDRDGDGLDNSVDNCLVLPNPVQEDGDNDGRGDDCDNCPTVSNTGQENSDRDIPGDACDVCPSERDPGQANSDTDSLGDMCDNCDSTDNQDQANTDGDGVGNACDNCPLEKNTGQSDTDNDGIGNACDSTPEGVFWLPASPPAIRGEAARFWAASLPWPKTWRRAWRISECRALDPTHPSPRSFTPRRVSTAHGEALVP